MSKPLHPDPGLLLRYADGELGGATRDEIGKHLAQCAACSESLHEIESGAAEYRHNWTRWRENTETPTASWFDLRREMERMDAPPVAIRSHGFPAGIRWAAAAAALVAAMLVYRFSEQPVNAAELLTDAAKREAVSERDRPLLRVTTRSANVVRPALLRGTVEPIAAIAQPIQVRFEAANYSWEDPLSARAFSAWRAKLPDPKDKVVKLRAADGDSSYEITTQTTEGTLAEASLRLRVSDLGAVEGRFRFRDNELVHIVEAPGAQPDIPSASPNVAEAVVTREPSHAPAMIEPVTPGEELRVWAALRRIGADLGEQIEVERDTAAGTIIVAVVGLNAERRRTLEEALHGVSKVQLRFGDTQPVREPGRRVTDRGAAPDPVAPQSDPRLRRELSEEFVDGILEASESALVRVHALRKLAEHYPPEIETQLSIGDQTLLASLLEDHFAGVEAASRRVFEVARQFVPQAPNDRLAPSLSWQEYTRRLVSVIEQVDQALSKTLAGGGPPQPGELESALGRLQARLDAAPPAFQGPH